MKLGSVRLLISSMGRICFCFIKFLVVVREVNILFLEILNFNFFNFFNRFRLFFLVVLVINLIITEALRNLEKENLDVIR